MPKRTLSSKVFLFVVLVFAVCMGAQPAFSQTTISTGGIVGTVTDQSGALVPGANVTIINKAIGRQLNLTTNLAGLYNSGPLTPADYTVRVVAPGFATAEINLTVQVNNTANGDVALRVGSTTTTVEVQFDRGPSEYGASDCAGRNHQPADRKFAHQWPQFSAIGAA